MPAAATGLTYDAAEAIALLDALLARARVRVGERVVPAHLGDGDLVAPRGPRLGHRAEELAELAPGHLVRLQEEVAGDAHLVRRVVAHVLGRLGRRAHGEAAGADAHEARRRRDGAAPEDEDEGERDEEARKRHGGMVPESGNMAAWS